MKESPHPRFSAKGRRGARGASMQEGGRNRGGGGRRSKDDFRPLILGTPFGRGVSVEGKGLEEEKEMSRGAATPIRLAKLTQLR